MMDRAAADAVVHNGVAAEMLLYMLFVAVILGIVEGATEFIPVSSTGHLILVSDWLGFTGREADVFAVVIQLGAILAIMWLYRETFIGALRGVRTEPAARRFLLNIGIATLPAAFVGFLAHDFIMERLFSPLTVAAALMVGGVVILIIEWWRPPTRVEEVRDMSLALAVGVGLAQVIALFPGVSRSAATILGGFALGLSRRAATEFSFFLAVPIMLAASGYELMDTRTTMNAADLLVLSTGFVTSFVTALIIVKAFLRFVAGHTFRMFAWYRIALGGILIGYYLL